ncbi:unnamed protein product [Withania somnifera]
MANAHRRNNFIGKLVVEGECIDDPRDIKREIVQYYQTLYDEIDEWRPICNLLRDLWLHYEIFYQMLGGDKDRCNGCSAKLPFSRDI